MPFQTLNTKTSPDYFNQAKNFDSQSCSQQQQSFNKHINKAPALVRVPSFENGFINNGYINNNLNQPMGFDQSNFTNNNSNFCKNGAPGMYNTNKNSIINDCVNNSNNYSDSNNYQNQQHMIYNQFNGSYAQQQHYVQNHQTPLLNQPNYQSPLLPQPPVMSQMICSGVMPYRESCQNDYILNYNQNKRFARYPQYQNTKSGNFVKNYHSGVRRSAHQTSHLKNNSQPTLKTTSPPKIVPKITILPKPKNNGTQKPTKTQPSSNPESKAVDN